MTFHLSYQSVNIYHNCRKDKYTRLRRMGRGWYICARDHLIQTKKETNSDLSLTYCPGCGVDVEKEYLKSEEVHAVYEFDILARRKGLFDYTPTLGH